MKVKRFLTLMLILSITMVSCKKDGASTDNGTINPNNPTNYEDPEGTIIANIRNDDGYITLFPNNSGGIKLKMNSANNFIGIPNNDNNNVIFASVCETDGLGYILDVPQSGWSSQLAVIPNNGYIIKFEEMKQDWIPEFNTWGTPYYVYKYARIYVVDYILSINNEILGANIKYQEYWNPIIISPLVVTNITSTTATFNGDVTGHGIRINQKGVCWSINENPTYSDGHVVTDSGDGTFTCQLTNLMPNTTYYARVFASIPGECIYGEQVRFTTERGLPTVTINEVTQITHNSALLSGIVTNNGGSNINQAGFCWGLTHNPNLNDSFFNVCSGPGEFTIRIHDLEQGSCYYVRSYATNDEGTNYSDETCFVTESFWDNGVIPEFFSVSNTKKVYFSQGNLQYLATSNTWRFASKQYDYCGYANQYMNSSYNNWIDLFGWGTSGYDHGATCYQPYSTALNVGYYLAYGNTSLNLYDETGMADWGYNSISNGGNINDTWRTLNNDEWNYVLIERSTSSGLRFAKAQVNGVNGVILLPDNWNNYTYYINNPNDCYGNYDSNIISRNTWIINFETHGAVFLPASGIRMETTIYNNNDTGYYWSSSNYIGVNDYGLACIMVFYNNDLSIGASQESCGLAVRLVQDAY